MNTRIFTCAKVQVCPPGPVATAKRSQLLANGTLGVGQPALTTVHQPLATMAATAFGPSMREKASGWGLDARAIRFFNSQWVPDPAQWSDPGVSPLHAPDLSGLPAALVVTAEHDPPRTRGRPTPGASSAPGWKPGCAASPGSSTGS